MDELTERLRELGIRQEGDPVLRRVCRPFDLPRERAQAARLWERLLEYVPRLLAIYPFTKGIGLAAPQIGLASALALVKPRDGEPFPLVNPTVTWRSERQDERYEGCLSLFDVRLPVRRPLGIEVETSGFDGERRRRRFEQGLARLVLHEIDHLEGTLARDLVPPGARVVPLSEYQGRHRAWEY